MLSFNIVIAGSAIAAKRVCIEVGIGQSEIALVRLFLRILELDIELLIYLCR